MAPSFYEQRNVDCTACDFSSGKRHLRCPSHMHHHIEFVYMIEGSSDATVDTRRYNIKDDSCFLVFPNQIHSYAGMDEQKYYLFIINPDIFPELAPYFSGRVPVSPLLENIKNYPEIRQLLELVINERRRPVKDNLRDVAVRGYLLALFSLLFRYIPMDDCNRVDEGSFRHVVEFCTQNYNRELSLEVLGEELHLSKYYISHLFSDKFQMRFTDYINSLRVADACRYLDSTELSITEIAGLVGFGTLRTFNRAFSKIMGVAPSAYKRARMMGRNVSEKAENKFAVNFSKA